MQVEYSDVDPKDAAHTAIAAEVAPMELELEPTVDGDAATPNILIPPEGQEHEPPSIPTDDDTPASDPQTFPATPEQPPTPEINVPRAGRQLWAKCLPPRHVSVASSALLGKHQVSNLIVHARHIVELTSLPPPTLLRHTANDYTRGRAKTARTVREHRPPALLAGTQERRPRASSAVAITYAPLPARRNRAMYSPFVVLSAGSPCPNPAVRSPRIHRQNGTHWTDSQVRL